MNKIEIYIFIYTTHRTLLVIKKGITLSGSDFTFDLALPLAWVSKTDEEGEDPKKRMSSS